ERVTDLKGLMGDASDNIPGVPRIGPKTAVKLLQEYGTLENVLANAHAIKGQVGENLRAYADQARLSKELSIIKTDAPARFDEDALRRRPPNMEALTELATQLEFRTLLECIRKQAGAAEESGGADGKTAAARHRPPAAARAAASGS